MKIQVITANNGWFIKSCGDKWKDPSIGSLYFNGKLPEKTFSEEWYRIEPNATTVQRKMPAPSFNQRYELKNHKLECEDYPIILSVYDYKNKTDDESENYCSEISALYEYKYEIGESYFEDVEVEFEYIMQCNVDIIKPSLNFKASQSWSSYSREWVNRNYTHSSVQHQGLDKIIFPDIMLPLRPSSFTSQQMYDITRNYIKDHINKEVAEITSDYDFCFEVKKIIKKITPETYTYYNLFARTKKERNKLHTGTKIYDEYTIFEMTYSPKNYDRYTPIPAMYAENEEELENKVNAWLEHIIKIINEPLCQCPTCEGKGYLVPDKIDLKG